jgi:hypothetical protein
MKNAIITILVLALVGAGIYYFIFGKDSPVVDIPNDSSFPVADVESQDAATSSNTDAVSTTSEEMTEVDETETLLGTSAGGNDIVAYHYGTGTSELLFVGGIHGGYSWNTALVAFNLIDHLDENPDAVPDGVKVTVIPVLNPDGLDTVVGTPGKFSRSDAPASGEDTTPGRFNGNEVDLNRNFNCDWQADAMWQNTPVSGGDEAFSEPESAAIRDYIEQNTPAGVIVWYSAAGGVFASNCYNGVLEETTALTELYAEASDYKAYTDFDFYEVTGDMTNWLAGEEIPAISVLLTNHRDVEWDKNKAGIEAVIASFAN